MTTADQRPQDPGATTHRWRFARLGGFDQVRLETGADLAALGQLDQKLWAALSCPSKGLEFDEHTLALVDGDGDGRIRAPELLAAAQWACAVLKDPASLIPGAATLPLAAIDDQNEEGARMLASARQILVNLGKPEADAIGPADTIDTVRIFAGTRFNGDGVVPASAAEDEATRAAIEDIMACVGSEPDRGGSPGVTEALVQQFFDEAAAYAQWWGEADDQAASLKPLGEDTAAAAEAFEAVRAKVDDYFTRCRLAAYDAHAAEPLNPSAALYGALAPLALSSASEDIAALPIARVEADGELPLGKGVNPAWADAVAALRDRAVEPLLGRRERLSMEDWEALSARFAAYETWFRAKRGAKVESLGIDRVRALLDGGARAAVDHLIAEDKALAKEADAMDEVDRLVHYHRDLFTLLNNFVAFRDFYLPGEKAIFQAGTLYLDGRSCELCVRVDDAGKHATLAGLSRTYLAYCECRRRGSGEKMTIAAAFTGGDAQNLMVGRNGVFYDRAGGDWDATITKIIEHPISVSQAFWAPYRRIGRMIGEQMEKFAAARDKAVDAEAAGGIAAVGKTAEGGKPAPLPFDVAKFAGIFAAIGLAVGAIGTAIASVVTGFLTLSWWQMPLALAGLMLAISGPSMLLAFLKLRQRNLGPILDATGWAVNTRAMINIPFGSTLTGTAALPPGAERTLRDPFAEKRKPWKRYVFLVLFAVVMIALWQGGHLQRWWQQAAGGAPPAATAAPPAK